jgi:hypothetical protein
LIAQLRERRLTGEQTITRLRHKQGVAQSLQAVEGNQCRSRIKGIGNLKGCADRGAVRNKILRLLDLLNFDGAYMGGAIE